MKQLRTYIEKHQKEFWLVSLAIIAQSIVFIVTNFWGYRGFMWLADSESYLEIAKNFLAHKGFYVNIEWGPQTFRTPLYPLFIAIFYKIIPEVWFVIFVQNILGVISVLLTYKIGKIIFNQKAAFLGSLFLIFESARLSLTNQLMSEALFVFFVLLAAIYFLKFLRNDKNSYLIISAAMTGLAALTRPIIQFFPFAVILFLAVFGITQKNLKKYLSAALLFFTIFIVVISPWLIRNYIHFGKWQLSSEGGYQVYFIFGRNFVEYKANKEGKTIGQAPDEKIFERFSFNEKSSSNWVLEATRMAEPEYEEYFLQEGLKLISPDIPSYIALHLKRVVTTFIESSASRSYGVLLRGFNLPPKIFYPFLYFSGKMLWVLFYIIITASFIFYFKEYRKFFWNYLFIIGTIFYFVIPSAMYYDAGRFRQPVNPFIFLFLSQALILFYGQFGKKIEEIAAKNGIEDIVYQGKLIAFIVKKGYAPKKETHFLTDESLFQQVGFLKNSQGYVLKRHIHNAIERTVIGTPEAFLVRQGKIKVCIYSMDKKLICERIIKRGDMLFCVGGGHGFEFLVDSILLEIKQGPYFEQKQDKEFF